MCSSYKRFLHVYLSTCFCEGRALLESPRVILLLEKHKMKSCTVSYNQALNCQMVFSYYYGQCEPHRVWTLCTQIHGRQTCHHFSHSSAIHKIVWNYASERVYSMHRGTQCKAWSWVIWRICVVCLKHPRLRFCNHYLHFFWYMFGFSQWRV